MKTGSDAAPDAQTAQKIFSDLSVVQRRHGGECFSPNATFFHAHHAESLTSIGARSQTKATYLRVPNK